MIADNLPSYIHFFDSKCEECRGLDYVSLHIFRIYDNTGSCIQSQCHIRLKHRMTSLEWEITPFIIKDKIVSGMWDSRDPDNVYGPNKIIILDVFGDDKEFVRQRIPTLRVLGSIILNRMQIDSIL